MDWEKTCVLRNIPNNITAHLEEQTKLLRLDIMFFEVRLLLNIKPTGFNSDSTRVSYE